MQPKKSDRQRSFLCPDLLDQLDPRNHLLGLAKIISRQVFEDNRGAPY
jgi:IS5 family transposase